MKNILPRILSIETSSEQASAALLIGSTSTFRCTQGVSNHSDAILPMVQSLLADAGISLAECDAIAFGAGPGAFTGVRTACGVVQGLAFGADLPVIPVVTLLALAEACRYSSGAVDVVAVLDARMGEVYWAQYHYDVAGMSWAVVFEPALCAPALVLPHLVEGVRLVGNGLAAYQDKFLLSAELLHQAEYALPDAQAVARLALPVLQAGLALSPVHAQPLYLRNKIALTIAERAALLV